jgi:NADH-quinone oxidoreductase subunit G
VAGSYRSLWAAPEVSASPALAFLHPRQRVEISPADAQRLGLRDGDEMLVSDEHGGAVQARVTLRDGVPAGRAFLAAAIASGGAENLRGRLIEIVAIPEPPPPEPEAESDPAEAFA